MYQIDCVTWTEKASLEKSDKILRALASRFSERSGLFDFKKVCKRGTVSEICTYPQPAGLSVEQLKDFRQAKALFEKNEAYSTAELNELAYDLFLRNERKCKETNDIILKYRYGSIRIDPYVDSILHAARRKIAYILGDVPSLAELEFQFGPGASTSCKRFTSARYKLDAKLTSSYNMSGVLEELSREVPTWLTSPVCLNDGELTFVPKTYKSRRTIVIEPLLNTFFQKGVGSYLKKRLREAGINLYSQTKNQDLAKLGSITNSLATVDLSSASDTISYQLVRELLPDDWFDLLDSLRTSVVVHKGQRTRLEKFSSMGNAYTFELESLIFGALALSVVDKRLHDVVSVYGDDIIVPSPYFAELRKVLEWCGFEVNLLKSYHDGPFRESCGKDFYLGTDIRPVYVKDVVSGDTLFKLHNGLYRRGDPMAKTIISLIPDHLRLFGPDGYGDGHLLSESFGYQKLKHRARGFHGCVFDTFTLKPKRNFRNLRKGDSLLPAYSIYESGGVDWWDPAAPTDHYVVRGSKGYRRLSVYTLSH